MASTLNTKIAGGLILAATLGAMAGVTLKSGYVAKDIGSREVVGTNSGSVVTAGGGTFQATNLADASCLKSTNGNYYNCHQEALFTATGGCVSGGCATKSYNVASVTIPYTVSGSIKSVAVTCNHANKTSTISVDQVAAATSSGVGFLSKVSIGSGSLKVYGSGSGILWRKDKPLIKVSASATVGVNAGCMLSVDSAGTYNN